MKGNPIMPEATKPHPDMSDYEAKAWTSLIEQVGRRHQRKQAKPIKKAEEIAAATFERIEKLLDDHEQLKQITDGLGKPLVALQDLVSRASAATVSSSRILKRAGRIDEHITSLDNLREADLSVADRLLRAHTLAYGVGMAAEGAATSLAITGAVVSSTVTGGATLAVAAGALSTDVAANLAAASRLAAKVAMSYGYDTRLPDEQIYALGVLNYGSTMTAGGKAASLGQLSRLVQTMARNPTHAQLDKYVLIKATKAFMKLLGFRVTHQRLAQFIPFAGVVLNAGTNAAAVTTLSERAQAAYRLRFLTEKYDLDASTWLSQVDVPSEGENDSIDLEQLIEDADGEGDQDR
jgi:hypothetical protein